MDISNVTFPAQRDAIRGAFGMQLSSVLAW